MKKPSSSQDAQHSTENTEPETTLKNPGRRKFVRQAVTLGAGMAVMGSAVSCSLFDEKEMMVCSLAELKEKGLVVVRFNRKKILARWEQEEVEIISLICSHKKCTVAYEKEADQFICPCHDGTYDHAGNVVSGPPEDPLRRFKAEIRGDQVWVLNQAVESTS